MKAKARFFYYLLLIFFLQTILISVAAAQTRIMPLGDSITYGISSGAIPNLPGYFVSYRKALWDKLVDAGYDVDFVGSLTNGSSVPDFDPNHEGHPGMRDDEIASNVNGYLSSNHADIILLHIGTNDLNTSPDDVEDILNAIDSYESSSGTEIWVILALIVNRACCNEDPTCLLTKCQDTIDFNDNVYDMASARSGDNIIIVDMENDAGIVYLYEPTGDMFDDTVGGIHPFETGYAKMANVWFSALEQILPDPDPDPPKKSSSSDSGCFISTATYALHMGPHAKAPVEFRDHFLPINFVGRAFVDFYHSIRHLRLISTPGREPSH